MNSLSLPCKEKEKEDLMFKIDGNLGWKIKYKEFADNLSGRTVLRPTIPCNIYAQHHLCCLFLLEKPVAEILSSVDP